MAKKNNTTGNGDNKKDVTPKDKVNKDKVNKDKVGKSIRTYPSPHGAGSHPWFQGMDE